MFYLRFVVRPKGSHPDSEIIGRSDVRCWIAEPVAGAAKAVAIGVIEQEHWEIESLEESREVTHLDFAGDPQALQRLDQASLDGMAFEFRVSSAERRPSEPDDPLEDEWRA